VNYILPSGFWRLASISASYTYICVMNLSNEIKHDLIERIGKIDDVNFLQAIQTILDTSNKQLFELSPKQSASLKLSRKQLDNGEGIQHKDVINDMTKWLKKE
jgi:hypothetical protein